MLSQYPDRAAARRLLDGFTNGFSLGFQGPRVARGSKCLSSAAQQPLIVLEKLQKEIVLGRVAGPFNSPPLPNLQSIFVSLFFSCLFLVAIL